MITLHRLQELSSDTISELPIKRSLSRVPIPSKISKSLPVMQISSLTILRAESMIPLRECMTPSPHRQTTVSLKHCCMCTIPPTQKKQTLTSMNSSNFSNSLSMMEVYLEIQSSTMKWYVVRKGKKI